MAIIYDATLTPDKGELLTAWLDRQDWGGTGEVEQIGAYRVDDPQGEVGLEGFILRRSGRTLHVPVTYRSAPLEEAELALVGTTQHSVLGERWVYDALADPVGRDLITRALAGELGQAELKIYEESGEYRQTQQNTVLLSATGQDSREDAADAAVLVTVREPEGEDAGAGRALRATWPGGEGVLFRA